MPARRDYPARRASLATANLPRAQARARRSRPSLNARPCRTRPGAAESPRPPPRPPRPRSRSRARITPFPGDPAADLYVPRDPARRAARTSEGSAPARPSRSSADRPARTASARWAATLRRSPRPAPRASTPHAIGAITGADSTCMLGADGRVQADPEMRQAPDRSTRARSAAAHESTWRFAGLRRPAPRKANSVARSQAVVAGHELERRADLTLCPRLEDRPIRPLVQARGP